MEGGGVGGEGNVAMADRAEPELMNHIIRQVIK